MDLKNELDRRPDLQHLLFRRGWLVTNAKMNGWAGRFPFYDNWQFDNWGGYTVATHRETMAHSVVLPNGVEMLLLGHCYNPFTMEHREEEQLRRIAGAYGTPQFQDRIDELTGVFGLVWRTPDGELHFMTDPSGMQPMHYGSVNEAFVISSHSQLIADVFSLVHNALAVRLRSYRFYPNLPGAYLPGDMSPFDGLRRVVSDFEYAYDGRTVKHKRVGLLADRIRPMGYEDTVYEGAQIMKKNLELIVRKWPDAAISLTGGIDSGTTFAACNGNYNRIRSFSYISASKESSDAIAAKKIAEAFDVRFDVFNVPEENDTVVSFNIKSEILKHNSAYFNPLYDNEIRKRIYLEENCDIPIEVKSWVSETVRGACYHRYRRKTMPRLSPKLYRNLYKVFLNNRKMAYAVDRVFAKFIEEFGIKDIPSIYPPADVYYHEVAWGAWGGENINEMKFCFDITIPYNNRRWLEMMFQVPLEDRLIDRHHLDMRKLLNREFYDMGIHVENPSETDGRARALNVIFTLNNWLPF